MTTSNNRVEATRKTVRLTRAVGRTRWHREITNNAR